MINAEDHISLVHKIANQLYKRLNFRYSYEDLFQTGCVGLMKAVNNFDASKGYKFSTYAHTYIKSTISNFARDDSWYMAKSCRDRLKNSNAPSSLDIRVGERETPIINLLSYTENGFNNTDLKMLVDNLPERLEKVIKLRYFEDFEVKEISRILKVSRQTVINDTKKAFEILREELQA